MRCRGNFLTGGGIDHRPGGDAERDLTGQRHGKKTVRSGENIALIEGDFLCHIREILSCGCQYRGGHAVKPLLRLVAQCLIAAVQLCVCGAVGGGREDVLEIGQGDQGISRIAADGHGSADAEHEGEEHGDCGESFFHIDSF